MIPEAAVKTVRILKEAGFESGLVGGAVRDMLLGRTPSDCDIVTTARPEELAGLFPDCKLVGASFGVSLIQVDGMEFEVATAREERFYLDGRHPGEVKYTHDLTVDMLRRDFTVNAMYFDGELHDSVGGVKDLERGVIRTVGDPVERFSEDYLRMLRAIRFASRFRFTLDPATERAIRLLAPKCAEIAGERIRDEVTRMLTGADPAGAVEMMERTGILKEILPEVAAMKGVEQPPEFHPEGDVFTHTLLMLRHMAAPGPLLGWCVLFHDIGKVPTAAKDETGRWRFFGHEALGAGMTAEICDRLRFSAAERDSVVKAVRDHMRFASVQEMKESKVRRLLAGPDFPLELELHRLDCISCHGIMDVFVFLLDRLAEAPEHAALPEPLLMGRDLVAAGIKPGPAFKEVLDAVFDSQLSGEVVSKEQALDIALKMLK